MLSITEQIDTFKSFIPFLHSLRADFRGYLDGAFSTWKMVYARCYCSYLVMGSIF